MIMRREQVMECIIEQLIPLHLLSTSPFLCCTCMHVQQRNVEVDTEKAAEC